MPDAVRRMWRKVQKCSLHSNTSIPNHTSTFFPMWVSGYVQRERERSTRGDRVLFSSVGLWEGFLSVKITWIPYHWLCAASHAGIRRPHRFFGSFTMSWFAERLVGRQHGGSFQFRTWRSLRPVTSITSSWLWWHSAGPANSYLRLVSQAHGAIAYGILNIGK